MHRERKEGLGAAYVAGYQYALVCWPDTPFFIQMDAYLSHDPVYPLGLLKEMEDADVVVGGARYVRGVSIVNWPLHRLIVSRLGTTFARIVTGLPLTDCTAGFKCYRAAVLRDLQLDTLRSNGYVQIETSFRAWRRGCRLRDFPIIFYERCTGTSKLNLSIAFESFWVVLGLGLERFLGRIRGKKPSN